MNGKVIALSFVLLDFAALSAYAVYEYGYLGVIQRVFADSATTLVSVDLVIALSLVVGWMWQDARARRVSVLPYIVLTLAFGSVGPLLYLIRREAAVPGAPLRAAAGVRA
jgi:hypothetical protein